MFQIPATTRYDLRFRLFGIPVLVHPIFWFTAVLLGPINDLSTGDGLLGMLIWIACVFVSILLHELGHAMAFLYFRCWHPTIWLQAFGGLTSSALRPYTPWQSIAVSLAGPGIQLLFFALLWASNLIYHWKLEWFPWLALLYLNLVWINVGWAIFNLLPIDPLDGGHIAREICVLAKLRRPDVTAMTISLYTAVGVIAAGLILRFVPGTPLEKLPSWIPKPSGLLCLLLMVSLAFASHEKLQRMKNYRGFWRDWK